MDNVVVEQQVLLVGIAIVDEMMVVVNVVLNKKFLLLNHTKKKFLFKIYVVDIEMDFDLIQAYYNVLMVLA
jgi:hypothetical protein